MKLYLSGMEWNNRSSYFYWWNWLPKDLRYFGYDQDWYDGPIYHMGFWYFNWSWSFETWDKYFYRNIDH